MVNGTTPSDRKISDPLIFGKGLSFMFSRHSYVLGQ